MLGDPDLADDHRFMSHRRRVENRHELDTRIAQRLASLDLESALELLERAGIACARLNDIAALPEHEQLTMRDRWVDTQSPVGTVRTLAPPWLPGGSHASLGGVPDVGADTDTVLRWLGLPVEDVERLRREEII